MDVLKVVVVLADGDCVILLSAIPVAEGGRV